MHCCPLASVTFTPWCCSVSACRWFASHDGLAVHRCHMLDSQPLATRAKRSKLAKNPSVSARAGFAHQCVRCECRFSRLQDLEQQSPFSSWLLLSLGMGVLCSCWHIDVQVKYVRVDGLSAPPPPLRFFCALLQTSLALLTSVRHTLKVAKQSEGY